MSIKFITNEQLYKQVIEPISKAKEFVWIGTADIKDLHAKHNGSVVSFLTILNMLIKRKVKIRLIHAKEPGANYKKSFDKLPILWRSMERQLCPRVHFKHIVIDGKLAYTGSAGLGIKSPDKRNFESGIITTNPDFIEQIMTQFDEVWMGKFCQSCGRKEYCSDPIL